MLVDLAGPKIRLGELPGDLIDCEPDAEFRFIRGDVSAHPHDLITTYEPLVDELNVGDTVMLADGTVGMKVVEKGRRLRPLPGDAAGIDSQPPGNEPARREAQRPGHGRRRSRRTPSGPPKIDIDFVGLSFVRQPQRRARAEGTCCARAARRPA